MMQHDDLIGMRYRAKFMSNDDYCFADNDFTDGTVHLSFVFRVDKGGGFVEHYDGSGAGRPTASGRLYQRWYHSHLQAF